jgi:hypothetical protein
MPSVRRNLIHRGAVLRLLHRQRLISCLDHGDLDAETTRESPGLFQCHAAASHRVPAGSSPEPRRPTGWWPRARAVPRAPNQMTSSPLPLARQRAPGPRPAWNKVGQRMRQVGSKCSAASAADGRTHSGRAEFHSVDHATPSAGRQWAGSGLSLVGVNGPWLRTSRAAVGSGSARPGCRPRRWPRTACRRVEHA